MPDGESIRAVTSFDDRLYVFREHKSSEQIEVYDIDSYRLLRCLTVPGEVPAERVAKWGVPSFFRTLPFCLPPPLLPLLPLIQARISLSTDGDK